MRTKDKQRERIDADIAAYLEAGGIVDTIPPGLSGETKRQLKMTKQGKPRYETGDKQDWRAYDRAKYEAKHKK